MSAPSTQGRLEKKANVSYRCLETPPVSTQQQELDSPTVWIVMLCLLSVFCWLSRWASCRTRTCEFCLISDLPVEVDTFPLCRGCGDFANLRSTRYMIGAEHLFKMGNDLLLVANDYNTFYLRQHHMLMNQCKVHVFSY